MGKTSARLTYVHVCHRGIILCQKKSDGFQQQKSVDRVGSGIDQSSQILTLTASASQIKQLSIYIHTQTNVKHAATQ